MYGLEDAWHLDPCYLLELHEICDRNIGNIKDLF